jgi:hypothetical protein
LKLTDSEVFFTRKGGREQDCGHNNMLKLAIESKADEIIFSDNDMRPHELITTPFLESTQFDLTCPEYPTGCPTNWKNPNEFHIGMWRAKRSVVKDIGLAAFSKTFSADGCSIDGCACLSFIRRAARLGYTFGHAGRCGHDAKTSDGIPDMLCYGKKET